MVLRGKKNRDFYTVPYPGRTDRLQRPKNINFEGKTKDQRVRWGEEGAVSDKAPQKVRPETVWMRKNTKTKCHHRAAGKREPCSSVYNSRKPSASETDPQPWELWKKSHGYPVSREAPWTTPRDLLIKCKGWQKHPSSIYHQPGVNQWNVLVRRTKVRWQKFFCI